MLTVVMSLGGVFILAGILGALAMAVGRAAGKSWMAIAFVMCAEASMGLLLYVFVQVREQRPSSGDVTKPVEIRPSVTSSAQTTPYPIALPLAPLPPTFHHKPSTNRTTIVPAKSAHSPRVWKPEAVASLPYAGPEVDIVRLLLSHYRSWTISGNRFLDQQIDGSGDCGSETLLQRAAQEAWAVNETAAAELSDVGHRLTHDDLLAEQHRNIRAMIERLRYAVYTRSTEDRKALRATEKCSGVDWEWMDFRFLEERIGHYAPTT